jgi:hypothetical protein
VGNVERNVTQYLVLWDHWQTSGDATALVKDDLKSGKFKDWGIFATTGRGFVIVTAKDELELLQMAAKYREFGVHCLSAEPFFSIDQIIKIQGG